jgi:hypothetical protein
MGLKTVRICNELSNMLCNSDTVIDFDGNHLGEGKYCVYEIEPFIKHFSECKTCKESLIDLYDNHLSDSISFMLNTLINNLLINKIREDLE